MTQPHTSTPAISVTYKIDEPTFMRACHAMWNHRAIGKTGNYVAAGIVGLCALYLFSIGTAGNLPYFMVLGLGVFVVLTVLRDMMWRRHYRHQTKYRAPITATLSDDLIEVVFPDTQATLPWSTFTSHLTTDEFLLLIISQRQFSIIPMASFQTPDMATRAIKLAAAHLPALRKRYL